MAYKYKSWRETLTREQHIELLKKALDVLYRANTEISFQILSRRAVRGTVAKESAMLSLLAKSGLSDEERAYIGIPEARAPNGTTIWYDQHGKRNK